MNRSKCPHCRHKLGDFLYADACPRCHEPLKRNQTALAAPEKIVRSPSRVGRVFWRIMRFVES